MYYNPQPKVKRIDLPPKEYQELRERACKRAMNHCEICNCWCPIKEGHFDHIKTRGAGGDDTLENGRWICWECHNLRHAKGIGNEHRQIS